MDVVHSPQQMQQLALRLRREGKRIACVPTMGYLHAGHLSLMRAARAHADWLVASIFVNPIQFGPGEDFAAYPRNIERDMALCRDSGVDALFCPAAHEIYAEDHSVFVEETLLSRGLCGALRPGHFRGVTTVVAKLFNIVQPHVAVFGQKDAQQARIIEKMAHDLNFPVQIVVAPTLREPDGLAMSSRNVYLSAEERRRAVVLYESLQEAERLYAEGVRDASRIVAGMREILERAAPIGIEYISVVDYATLSPVREIAGAALVAVCARIGRTRLIDNAILR